MIFLFPQTRQGADDRQALGRVDCATHCSHSSNIWIIIYLVRPLYPFICLQKWSFHPSIISIIKCFNTNIYHGTKQWVFSVCLVFTMGMKNFPTPRHCWSTVETSQAWHCWVGVPFWVAEYMGPPTGRQRGYVTPEGFIWPQKDPHSKKATPHTRTPIVSPPANLPL